MSQGIAVECHLQKGLFQFVFFFFSISQEINYIFLSANYVTLDKVVLGQ